MASSDNTHRQLIESICSDVLPRMVRIYEGQRKKERLDYDYYVGLMDRKVEQANRSLLKLNPVEREKYRSMIDEAYASNIDHLREVAAPQTRNVR